MAAAGGAPVPVASPDAAVRMRQLQARDGITERPGRAFGRVGSVLWLILVTAATVTGHRACYRDRSFTRGAR
jgi:hypothetical protein